MEKEQIKLVIFNQIKHNGPLGVPREIESSLINCPEVLLITGVRRCGKSTLVRQIREKSKEKDYYINFDDERLLNFQVDDFQKLDEAFMEEFGKQNTYYLDEIQNVEGWQRYVSRLYGEGKKVIITGSNANLLSKEMGTYLTGRHVTKELFPFSFKEFLLYRNEKIDRPTFFTTEGRSMLQSRLKEYLVEGGFPQYVGDSKSNFIKSLYNDIIFRDIIARYNLNSEKTLRDLVQYLASNTAHPFSYTSLAKAIGIKSTETIKDYLSYLTATYIITILNKYDYSVGKQVKGQKKAYFIDNAIVDNVGFAFSENKGYMLENAVFVELQRRGKTVFFHSDNNECDFLVQERNKIVDAYQVSIFLDNDSNRKREIDGLLAAMERYDLPEGYIITMEQNEEMVVRERNIHVVAAWQWLLQ